MRHRTRRLLRMGTGWVLVWTALVAIQPPAFADTPPGQAIRVLQQLQQSRASTHTAPVRADKEAACQPQCQAMLTTLGALNARVQAAQSTNDPAQMRAALAEVKQQQTAMQEQIARCMERRESPRHGQ